MIDRNGKVINLCKCCVIDGESDVKKFDFYNTELLSELPVEYQKYVNQDMVELLGYGTRCNLLGGPLIDNRVKDTRAYFYKIKEKENNESKKD